jgi:hypothetical protein
VKGRERKEGSLEYSRNSEKDEEKISMTKKRLQASDCQKLVLNAVLGHGGVFHTSSVKWEKQDKFSV